MPSVRSRIKNVRFTKEDVARLTRKAREKTEELAKRVAKPEKFEGFKVDRVSQLVALLLVGPVIVVSLVIIVVINSLMVDVFLNGAPLAENQTSIAGFLVTGITMGLFIFFAWFWFQWVRTGGLGYFAG